MGARMAEWHLLGLEDDPVPSGPSDIDPVIEHYARVTTALIEQSALMRRLGDGDETVLKGESADAMRKRAKDSAETLDKASTRYRNLRLALGEYRGSLETARSRSKEAVDAAVAANRSRQRAENTADPANEPREENAPEPSAQDVEASADRADAIESASGALREAIELMRRTQSDFDAAAELTASRIRAGWDDDGLTNTLGSEIEYAFVQVLKVLVEVLGYIGMALAVIGLLFPGVGWMLMAGAIAGLVGVIASSILAGMGEGNILNVILGVVGLLTLGLGAALSRIAASSAKAATAGGRAALDDAITPITQRLNNTGLFNSLDDRIGSVVSRINSTPVGGAGRVQVPRTNTAPVPGGVRTPPPPSRGPVVTPLPARLNTLETVKVNNMTSFVNFITKPAAPAWATNFFARVTGITQIQARWSIPAVLGIDDAVKAATASALVWNAFGQGAGNIPKWMYFGAVANVYGLGSGIFGIGGAPSDIASMAGADDPRSEWTITDVLYSDLTFGS